MTLRQQNGCKNVKKLEAVGINEIFAFRSDEEVHHDEDVAKKLGKGERPDRVYGLRQTRNIENLLYDEAKAHFQVNPVERKQVQEHVLRIWSGSIITRDGALQLLLLIDYIFDWARDVYREDVIRELRVLATGYNDAASEFYTDHDIFSTVPVDTLDHTGVPTGEGEDLQASLSLQASFTEADARTGVIRHASLIESSYCCVFVTRDNVKTLLNSVPQPKLVGLCRKVLNHMRDACSVELSALDAVEQQWTGSARLSSRQLMGTKFYTVMSFSTYISSSWHLVRELFAIAIAEDAWEDIIVASKLKQGRGKARPPVTLQDLDGAALLNTIKRLQAGSPSQVLYSAISRRSLKLGDSIGGKPRLTMDDGEFRRIVHSVYVSFKKGNLEPQEPFLRISRRLDQQHLLDIDVEPHFRAVPEASENGCVLLTATCYPEVDANRSKSEFCAYLTSGTPRLPPRQELADIVVNAFETRDVYHTTRSHWSSVLAPFKPPDDYYRGAWNIEDTYGVYTKGFGFLAFVTALSSRIPVTQGSSRAPGESGSQLYERNFSPWRDSRLLYRDRKARMFILYKLFSREMRFWRNVARERKAQGMSCCECCAAIGEEDVCNACTDVLFDDGRYTWFKLCLKGEEPFTVAPLEGLDLQRRLHSSENHELSLREYIWNRRHDGPTDDDGDWAWNLDFHTKLEEPFDDMMDLFGQWREYVNFCNKSKDWKYAVEARKRKREEAFENESREELDRNGADSFEDELGSSDFEEV
ncbi:hypothetical protein N0V90_002138 [Kalmusia sp. IMI 367209]|nr:hypothetical protein N0V90_002138 [Kalmusia sp. IMI 367209]